LFDRFAAWASSQVARAWFFTACVLLVLLWLPSFVLIGSLDTWQLVINTTTTIITFLLVALLQNSAERTTTQTLKKLDEIVARQKNLEARIFPDERPYSPSQEKRNDLDEPVPND
jgi:low affinity Fe/Cu permease